MVFNMGLPARFETPTDGLVFGFKILTAETPRPAQPDADALYLSLNKDEVGQIVISSLRPQTTELNTLWLCIGTTAPMFTIRVPSAGTGLPLEWALPIIGVYHPGNSAGYYQWESVSPLFLYSGGGWKELTQDGF